MWQHSITRARPLWVESKTQTPHRVTGASDLHEFSPGPTNVDARATRTLEGFNSRVFSLFSSWPAQCGPSHFHRCCLCRRCLRRWHESLSCYTRSSHSRVNAMKSGVRSVIMGSFFSNTCADTCLLLRRGCVGSVSVNDMFNSQSYSKKNRPEF